MFLTRLTLRGNHVCKRTVCLQQEWKSHAYSGNPKYQDPASWFYVYVQSKYFPRIFLNVSKAFFFLQGQITNNIIITLGRCQNSRLTKDLGKTSGSQPFPPPHTTKINPLSDRMCDGGRIIQSKSSEGCVDAVNKTEAVITLTSALAGSCLPQTGSSPPYPSAHSEGDTRTFFLLGGTVERSPWG